MKWNIHFINRKAIGWKHFMFYLWFIFLDMESMFIHQKLLKLNAREVLQKSFSLLWAIHIIFWYDQKVGFEGNIKGAFVWDIPE